MNKKPVIMLKVSLLSLCAVTSVKLIFGDSLWTSTDYYYTFQRYYLPIIETGPSFFPHYFENPQYFAGAVRPVTAFIPNICCIGDMIVYSGFDFIWFDKSLQRGVQHRLHQTALGLRADPQSSDIKGALKSMVTCWSPSELPEMNVLPHRFFVALPFWVGYIKRGHPLHNCGQPQSTPVIDSCVIILMADANDSNCMIRYQLITINQWMVPLFRRQKFLQL